MPILGYLISISLATLGADELALVRQDNDGYSLCMWQQDWQEPRIITKLPAECSRLSWSPDGLSIVASLAFPDNQGLWLYDLDGKKGKRLKTLPSVDATDAIFSPEGKWIYYTTDSSEGGTIRRIRTTDERDEAIMEQHSGGGTTGWVAWLLWDHEGKSLYYMHDEGWGEWQLWHFDLATGAQEPIWEDPCGTPTLSPDGSTMLMWSSADDPAQICIVQFTVDTTNGHITWDKVFASDAPWQSMPGYSRDGKLVAFVTGKGEEAAEGEKTKAKPSNLYDVTDIWIKAVGEEKAVRLPGSTALGRDCPAWRPPHE